MKRTPVFLMANLGSEVSQIFKHLENSNKEMAEFAFVRSQSIFEELLSHPDLKGRTKEVEILKDLVEGAISDKRDHVISRQQIEEYFLPFSMRILSN